MNALKSTKSGQIDITGEAPLQVLVFDDDSDDRTPLRSTLDQCDTITFQIAETAAAEDFQGDNIPDVILLNLKPPVPSGLEALSRVVNINAAPVVVVTGYGNEKVAVDAMKAGAYDYLPQDILNKTTLAKALRYTKDKWTLIKEKERLQEELAHLVMYDTLTELLTRRALFDNLEGEVQRTKRYQRDLTILMVDLDLFKNVNDTHGHVVGDEVLRRVARTLRDNTRKSDFIGRYGGEEFLAVLPETALDKALILAEKLRARVAEISFQHQDKTLKDFSVSIGAATYEDDPTMERFLSRADHWLYRAKECGRNQVQPAI